MLAYEFVLSRAVKKAKKIITVSNSTREEIVDHLKVDPSKIAVTYEGIEDALISKVKTQNSKLQLKTQKYFLYVGNAYPHKNLERLLEAFSSLKTNRKLVLVGKKDYFYKRLKKKVEEMKLANSVIFMQNVTDEELSSLYQNALALVLPSLMEGFGLTALEAMGNRCLVLSSDIPASHEVCADAAIYFDPFDVYDIRNKMEKVLLNDSSTIAKGLERVKLFSWRKMAKETLLVYENVDLNP